MSPQKDMQHICQSVGRRVKEFFPAQRHRAYQGGEIEIGGGRGVPPALILQPEDIADETA